MTQEEKNVTAPASRTAGWPSPFDDMDEWFDVLQRRWLSHSLLGHGWPDIPTAFDGRIPKVDVIDRNDEIFVKAELPGVKKDDLEVTLSDNLLTLQARVEQEAKTEEGKYHRRELRRGEFRRTLALPAPVDEKAAKATFRNGVLELHLPKVAGYSPKAIKVE